MLLCLAVSIPATALASTVRVETPLGSFDIELFEEDAPKTVENFLNYVRDGDFENSFVHRSVPGFVIQAGGFTFADGATDDVPTDPPVENEFNQSNLRGTVAMAKIGGNPDSATSQWFVNLANNASELDDQNGGFTVFGRVIGDGMDVVDAIAALRTWGFAAPFNSLPLIDYGNDGPVEDENIVFTSITLLDDPEAADTEIDITGLVDISSDAVPDIAYLTSKDLPKVRYYSGGDRKKIRTVKYFGSAWTAIAAATVADSDGNGANNDPAVAVLATKASAGRHTVEVRKSRNGALLTKIDFMGATWEVLDVAVIDDSNGDGVTDDAVVAVLGYNAAKPSEEQIRVQVKRLSDGSVLGNFFFYNEKWTPVAVEGVQRPGKAPLLAVLATNNNNGNNVVQSINLKNGNPQPKIRFMDAGWVARDLAILTDANGDGTADDPAYLVLGNETDTGRNRVQARRVSSGTWLKNISMNSTAWESRRVMSVGDISGNLVEEVGNLAKKRADGSVSILLKDYDDQSTTLKISP